MKTRRYAAPAVKGLIESIVKKVSFYSTSSIVLCISVIVFIRHISHILSPEILLDTLFEQLGG